MKKYFAILAGVLAFSSANAADLRVAPVYKAPPPIPAWTWTGFYAGASVGASWGRASSNVAVSTVHSVTTDRQFVTDPPQPPVLFTDVTSAYTSGNTLAKLNGLEAGGQAGYNWQLQQWVLGIEGDAQALGRSRDATFSDVLTPFITATEKGHFKLPGLQPFEVASATPWTFRQVPLCPTSLAA